MIIDGLDGTVACTLHEWLKLGPLLVRERPDLDTVQITDREPWPLDTDRGRAFVWSLPSSRKELASYPSVEAAKAALSEACLAWARKEAGL